MSVQSQNSGNKSRTNPDEVIAYRSSSVKRGHRGALLSLLPITPLGLVRDKMTEMTEESRQSIQNQNDKVSTFGAISLFIFDFVKVFVVAVAIIIPVRWFLFQPFVVTGDSMEPNYQNGNYLIVDEITYRLRNPERGEVVVLRFPNDPSQFFIKRIVGLPNERLLIENGRVKVLNENQPEGFFLDERYLSSNNITYGSLDRTLDADEYFVLGDNRLSSSDSRVWGALSRRYVVGRVYVRVFPVTEFEIFKAPIYAFPSF